jgi:hypothetical protein
MYMIHENLIPRVQDGDKPEPAAQVVAAELQQCLADGLEEDGEHHLLVAEDQGVEGMRQGKDRVEVPHGQEIRNACLEPALFRERLALRAMTVAAGVVDRTFVTAGIAAFEVAALMRRSTRRDGMHDLEVR